MKSDPEFHVPAGYCLSKKGGRPPADARNIAVLLARQWKMVVCGAKAIEADTWIIEKWCALGIKEEAHIRRAVTKAYKALDGQIIVFDRQSGCSVTSPVPVRPDSTRWLWHPCLDQARVVEPVAA